MGGSLGLVVMRMKGPHLGLGLGVGVVSVVGVLSRPQVNIRVLSGFDENVQSSRWVGRHHRADVGCNGMSQFPVDRGRVDEE